MIDVLHSGFDGLDVAFQGRAGGGFLSALERAKAEAQETERPAALEWKGLTFDVMPTGASGYTYRLDTGPDGETWFIAKSVKEFAWNLRVSVKSMALAVHGYKAIRERLFERLEIFGATVLDHSIGRIDFAIDVHAPGFEIEPECIVAHWRSTCQQYREFKEGEDGAFRVVSQGRKINSVTVGKMPGRQVIVYDKRREVIDRRKSYWWDIWGLEDRKAPVWRVEVRAGKRELKERWNITSFEELDAQAGNILTETLRAIRLNAPGQTDTNVTRQEMHPIWKAAIERAADPFSGEVLADPMPVIEKSQAAMKDQYEKLVSGLAASYAVIVDVPASQAPEKISAALIRALTNHIKRNPSKFADAHARAVKRLRFVKEPGAWNVPSAYSDPLYRPA